MPASSSPRPDAPPSRALTGLAAVLGLAPDSLEPLVGRTPVHGITHDSRSVRPGDVYAALPGAHAHGATYAGDAAAAGAVAVLTDLAGRPDAERAGLPVLLADRPREVLGRAASWVYDDPARDLLMLGVTGTNGKTTTTYLLEAGLRAAGHRTGLIGTIETRIADEVLPSARTTPEATDLQALLARMREHGVTALAMEVSSHALALGRVDAVTYDAALFTNLSQDHLDFHADLEDYFAAKALLFTPEHARVGVVNLDDPWGRRLVHRAEGAGLRVVSCSAAGEEAADWRAVDVQLGPDGSGFRVLGPGGAETAAWVRMPGAFNVANALGAVVTLVEAGVDLAVAAAGVAQCAGVPGRMERVETGQHFLALVDYAHTPVAVQTLLSAVRPVTKGRVLAVLGCGGDRDSAKRPLMGRAVAELADLAVLTSDNPRSEDPLAIIAAMREGTEQVPAPLRAEVVEVPDREAAISLAVGRAEAGDTVVVAGKGHEPGQEIHGEVRPFDDRAVLRHALEQRGGA